MRKIIFILIFIPIVSFSQIFEKQHQQLILRGATLINSTGAPPLGPVDIVIEKNETSLHNEFILDRIGMIPLYIDPNLVQQNPLKYLFVLDVKNDNSKPITLITADDFDIYEIKKSVTESADYQNGMITSVDKNNYEYTKFLLDNNADINKQYYNEKDINNRLFKFS